MLENLARKKSLAPATARCRSCAALGGAAKGAALEFASGPARSFFSGIERIAEHSRDRFFAAQESLSSRELPRGGYGKKSRSRRRAQAGRNCGGSRPASDRRSRQSASFRECNCPADFSDR